VACAATYLLATAVPLCTALPVPKVTTIGSADTEETPIEANARPEINATVLLAAERDKGP
jgi:hypothetical protein